MEYAIPGFIQQFCTPNALITLSEYLEDYASEPTKAAGYRLIEAELMKIDNTGKREQIKQRITEVKINGKRDLYL
jgi:2-iminoacetate synthase